MAEPSTLLSQILRTLIFSKIVSSALIAGLFLSQGQTCFASGTSHSPDLEIPDETLNAGMDLTNQRVSYQKRLKLYLEALHENDPEQKLKLSQQTIESCRQYLQQDPDYVPILNLYIGALRLETECKMENTKYSVTEGKLLEAIRLAEKSDKIDSTSQMAKYERAYCLFRLALLCGLAEKTNDAYAIFRKAISAELKLVKTGTNKALHRRLLYHTVLAFADLTPPSMSKEALKYLDAALIVCDTALLSPKEAERNLLNKIRLLYNKGYLLRVQNELDKAIEIQDEVLDKCARALERKQSYEELELARIRIGIAFASYEKGAVLYSRGKNKEALDHLKMSLDYAAQVPKENDENNQAQTIKENANTIVESISKRATSGNAETTDASTDTHQSTPQLVP